MNPVIPLHDVRDRDRSFVGGKAHALARLRILGMAVPDALCIRTEAYDRYVALTGLRERIQLELSRKQFREMRWEELWDASLRIRNMFLRTPLPSQIDKPIRTALVHRFGDLPTVVRSSAPDEDSREASFAGLHESYVNIRGAERILVHIRLVWASLWSDAALLYRDELGLLSNKSNMAVLVQEIVDGDRSGVIFGINPNNKDQSVIESVYGLNAGLVDGTVEPDRWILDRKTGRLLDHLEPERKWRLVAADEGAELETLPENLRRTSPLAGDDLDRLFRLANQAEALFGSPQDIEWTFQKNNLYLLQARPITAGAGESSPDDRSWYLSLKRSLGNLKTLREKIESQLIPKMVEDADLMEAGDPDTLPDRELAQEIGRRKDRYKYWLEAYWKDFIPFAHGMRLFGQVYNDTVKPDDPFEFMRLLGTKSLKSLERNRRLQSLAREIDRHRNADSMAEGNRSVGDRECDALLSLFVKTLGVPCPPEKSPEYATFIRGAILPMVVEMARSETLETDAGGENPEILISNFLSRFEGESKQTAHELLDLGRSSYRLRDDDNIYLGRLERLMRSAVDAGRVRIASGEKGAESSAARKALMKMVEKPVPEFHVPAAPSETETHPSLRTRQIVGQPAGPGIARGKARVVLRQSDLFEFKQGEILVCDALDPTMTFIVPLAAGIVERRGGMLIHGAIIAREYGIPCVTGIAQATEFVRTGWEITLDGYLGILIIG